MRIFAIQHVACEPAGIFEEESRAAGHTVRYARPLDGDRVPALPEMDALVILGGPMNADEDARFPFLAAEKRLLADAVRRGLPILGVCLGAQLLARSQGWRVWPTRPKEVGWYPVRWTPEASRDPIFREVAPPPRVFQWHGDTFDLGPGAVRLAASDLVRNQAFRVGRLAWGIQFHLEVTAPMIDEWCAAYASEEGLPDTRAAAIPSETPEHLGRLERAGRAFARGWLRVAAAPRRPGRR